MTLEEGNALLDREGIGYEQRNYGSQKEYWEDTMRFPRAANAGQCSVTVLRIPAPNGTAHLGLQFNERNGVFEYVDLWFGAYSFELWDGGEEELLECIRHVRSGQSWCAIRWDLDRKRWCGDAMYDLQEDPGPGKLLEALARPKDFWERLFKKHFLHEVYDWNEYHCIER